MKYDCFSTSIVQTTLVIKFIVPDNSFELYSSLNQPYKAYKKYKKKSGNQNTFYALYVLYGSIVLLQRRLNYILPGIISFGIYVHIKLIQTLAKTTS